MTEWQFIPKNDETVVCKSWIKLKPSDGILAPNESVDVEVVVDMTADAAMKELSTKNDNVSCFSYFRSILFFLFHTCLQYIVLHTYCSTFFYVLLLLFYLNRVYVNFHYL